MLTCLGCGAADDGVEGLGDVLQAGEGHAQARAVLVVGQRARHPVEVEADRGRDVLAERLHIVNKIIINMEHYMERNVSGRASFKRRSIRRFVITGNVPTSY